MNENEVIESTATEIALPEQSTRVMGLNADLYSMQVAPISLIDLYWKPTEGEVIRCVVTGFEKRVIESDFSKPDPNTGEILPIDVVMLVAQNEHGDTWSTESASTMYLFPPYSMNRQ